MQILIAEDLAQNRLILETYLKNLGHTVVSAEDGIAAFEILAATQINFLITDWVMPKMEGPELCTKVRKEILDRYVYIIIITAHTETGEVVKALEAGADDFVKKPFHPAELKSRISTGVRILGLEKRLEEKNTQLRKANDSLNRTFSIIKDDIDTAAILQKELLPQNRESIDGYAFDWIYMPTRGVAGDIFNFRKTDYGTIDFYQIDVAGHGVASAMLAYTLSKFLGFMQMPVHYEISEILTKYQQAPLPSEVMDRLNTMFYKEHDAMQFFTVVYGSIDVHNNSVTISRAGHPLPIISRKQTDGEVIRTKGGPVGFFRDSEFKDEVITLSHGSRLFLYSDGVLDVENSKGEAFGFERLQAIITGLSEVSLHDCLARIKEMLIQWKGDDLFVDDVSILVVEKE